MKYIALLRAINVGGHSVKMDYLRTLFVELGFSDVRTYIQTGNVFFESTETNTSKLSSSIEQHLSKALGYEVPTVIRTIPELAAIIASNPFQDIPIREDTRHCILFLTSPVLSDIKLPLTSPKGDFTIISASTQDLFVVLHLPDGRTGGNPSPAIEKLFKTRATARFYHTTIKMLEAATVPE